MAAEKTTAFLYLLMREHLPVGVVARLVGEAQTHSQISYESETGALAYRLADMLDDEPGELPADEEREELPVQPLDTAERGGWAGLDLSDEMVEWLDQFDDRISSSPDFIAVVNDAAEAGRPLSRETAELVAARVRELAERRRQGGGD